MTALTLIIPVYNGERFLRPLLDSVLAQTQNDWTCLCVNDGSTDSSRNILEEYATKDDRIRIVTQPNGGCGTARNTAMKLVETPYIMFADQDDLLHPQAFEIAVRAIERAKVDCLCFGFTRFCAPPTFPSVRTDAAVVPTQKRGLDLFTGRRDSWPIFVWRHIFRTEAVRDIPFPPISGGEDQAWMSELSWKNLSWASTDSVLYFNREDPHSRSRGISRRYIDNVMASYDWIETRAKLYDVDPRRLRRYIRHMRFMFRLSVIYRKLLRT